MMNRNVKVIGSGAAFALLISGAVLMSGCSKEEPAPAVMNTTPPPPPPPPKPKVTPVDQLMVQMNIDPRVNMPEAKAPAADDDRRAVLSFFDAQTRGNTKSFKNMLTLTDQYEMDALVRSGAWDETTSNIELVSIQTGTNSASQKCALAIIEVGTGPTMTFQPQLWYYNTENNSLQFEAAPTPPGIMDRLSGNDWIAAWHKILEEEMALADEPEVEFEVAQKDLDESDESSSGAQGAQGGGKGGLRGPTNPVAPPGMPDAPTGR